jgi:hypothetical protein
MFKIATIALMLYYLFRHKLEINNGLIHDEVFGSSRSVADSALLNKA